MEVADLIPVVHLLEDHVDDLEELLEPLFKRSLEETSKKLPLLERAKLLVLLTCTLESMIFSYLSLRGDDAKEHPVYKELTRVKQYFIKIKALESEPEKAEKPTMKLDQGAARRFISHGLAGNEQYDKERAEKLAKEKARAQLKAVQLAKQSEKEDSNLSSANEPSKASDSSSSSESESESEEDAPESVENKRNAQPPKNLKPAEEFIQLSSEPLTGLETAKAKAKKRKEAAKARKAERNAKKEGKPTGGVGDSKLSRKEARRKKQAKKKAKRAQQNQTS